MSEDRNIISQLQSLSPEELAKLGDIINSITNDQDEGEVEVPTERDTSRKENINPVDNNSEEVIIDHGPGRSQPRQRIVMPDEVEQQTEARSRGRGRTAPRRNANVETTPKQGRGRRLARTESVRLDGNNKFDKMRERNSHKADSKIDQALWRGREASERPEEFKFAEVQCESCQLYFDVNPSLVYVDPDSGRAKWTCNDCAGRGTHGSQES